jgi:O-succinylbenzoate synthase
MLETGIGRASAVAFAAHVAATHRGPEKATLSVPPLPTDLGPSQQYFDSDLTSPIVVDERGRIVAPTGPGIGVTPDPARLEAATVAVVSVPVER